MNLMPNFGFANMGYLMLLFERPFHKDLKIEKNFYPLKRYNVSGWSLMGTLTIS